MRILGFIVILFLAFFNNVSAQTISSSTAGDWWVAGNWNLNRTPISSDVVLLDGDVMDLALSSDYTIQDLDIGVKGGVNLTTSDPAYSFIVTNEIDVAGSEAVLDLSANLQTTNINLNQKATLSVAAGYVARAVGDLVFGNEQSTVYVYGVLHVGNLDISGNKADFIIYPGGQVIVDNNVKVSDKGELVVQNLGNMSVGGDVLVTGNLPNVDISGDMSVDGDFTVESGTVNVDTGGSLTVGGELTGTVGGAGEITVLPIELVSFEVRNELNANEITWSTASEKDNDFFTVERSYDAVNFEPIAMIYGAGTSYETNSYEHKDYFFNQEKVVYYRLKQTDYDGKFTYSQIVSTKENEFASLENSIDVSWNIDYIDIHIEEAMTDVRIELYNVKGQLLKAWKMASVRSGQNVQMGLNGTKNVMYILSFSSGNQKVVQKIMNL